MTIVLIRAPQLASLEVSPAPPVEAAEAAWEQPIDIVDQWGMDSFPASDPPANW